MATDVNDTFPRPMSLSKRYLSMPQELTGASLPPKVSGHQRGIVTLCVAHILPSAVSSSPLPRESLVRVRWWGEEAPGSLFRPSLLSGDGEAHTVPSYSPHRIIAMKYPVNVQPEQLLEYFHDMGHLTLDVIDRDSRRKFGECWLPLDLHRDNQVMTAEEKLVVLRRNNALCEIKPSDGEKGKVAGYLAVTFDVQWTERDVKSEEDFEIVEKEEFITVNWAEVVENEETRGKFEVESQMVEKKKPKCDEATVRRNVNVENRDFQRIQKLLEKGKALHQSMERAVIDEKASSEVADTAITKVAVDEQNRGLLAEADAQALASQWEKVLTDDGRLSSSENDSEFALSSISSNSSAVQENQVGESGPAFSVSGLDRPQQREVQQRIQHREVLKNSMSAYKSFQLAVKLEGVSNVKFSVLGEKSAPLRSDSGGYDGAKLLDGANVTLRYTVPSHFSRFSPASTKFDRVVTRKLRSSRWLDSVPLLWADLNGNVHIFQSEFADDSRTFFLSGYVIIETWLQPAKDAERRLLGLSKVPLKQLAGLFSYNREDLLSLLEKSLPCVSVDGIFPIEDPFSGKLAGYLRARVCIGTAEQLLTWAKTIRAVVKLQGIARGVLARKQFSRFAIFRVASTQRTSDIRSRLVALSNAENGSDSQSTAPTVTTARGGLVVPGFDSKVDTDKKHMESSSADREGYNDASENRPAMRKIRFDIRESWRAVMQQKSNQQHRGWSASPLLGCEMQGQLVITGSTGLPGKVKGVPFALWWDAVNSNLNSCFIHTFRARGAYLTEERGDLALVGPQSQVLFALHVENGFFGTQSRETIMGEARLNLYESFKKRLPKRQDVDVAMENFEVEEAWTDVDVPIVWDNGHSEHQELPSAIPLKITFFTSSVSQLMTYTEPMIQDASATEAPEQQEIKLSTDDESPDENAVFGPDASLPQRCDGQLESEMEENAVLADQFAYALVVESDEEEERAGGSVIPLLSDEIHAIDSLSETEMPLDQSTGLELTQLSQVDAADTVVDHSLELEDLSSSDDLVSIETASKPNSDTGAVEVPDIFQSCPNCASGIEYVEKAVQVDLLELKLPVEMVTCAVQTAQFAASNDERDSIISERSDDGKHLEDRDEETKTTVDVGCDAVDIASENHFETEEEAHPSLSSSKQELDDVTADVETEESVVDLPSETSSKPESDSGEVELQSDDISSSSSFVSDIGFVDEAVQADPFELGLQVEMVDCSVQTSFTVDSTVPEESDDGANLGDRAEEQKSTVDVGCDAIGFTDESHDQLEEDESQILATTPCKNDETEELVVPSGQDLVDRMSKSLSVEQPTHTTLPNEKLDLMYEMLREMRGIYVQQPVVEPSIAKIKEVSEDHNRVTEKSKSLVYKTRGIRDKHSSCPSSPISRVSSAHRERLTPLGKSSSGTSQSGPIKITMDNCMEFKDKRCSCPSSPVTQVPTLLRSPGASLVTNFGRTGALKPTTEFAYNAKKSSSQTQLVGRSRANTISRLTGTQPIQRTSYRDGDERKSYRRGTYGNTHQLMSSDLGSFHKRYHSQSEETSTHSSAHSLFAQDSETERIARIMQGSMNYWMKDDSSSSGGDEFEEETDEDCYF
ncbi:hypothetical protein GN244_ATG04725 [Phytophthora infestans]|uniref:C2CD3 N-terminal C2 domain-containing protein n=1 Tax=Phytophthora infestans TaxID=4787 RepID=A0A833T3X7_PHYIN|nr:hypothetical protein GN244_ATG04725 [Phytophthora infestans]